MKKLKLDIKDLGKFRLLGGLDVYKNKTAFTVAEGKDDYFSKIYLYDGRKVKPFTSGPKDSNPKFSPDGKLIAF
ncbi:S9 family peptidase, partial [Thermococci archaeon]